MINYIIGTTSIFGIIMTIIDMMTINKHSVEKLKKDSVIGSILFILNFVGILIMALHGTY